MGEKLERNILQQMNKKICRACHKAQRTLYPFCNHTQTLRQRREEASSKMWLEKNKGVYNTLIMLTKGNTSSQKAQMTSNKMIHMKGHLDLTLFFMAFHTVPCSFARKLYSELNLKGVYNTTS